MFYNFIYEHNVCKELTVYDKCILIEKIMFNDEYCEIDEFIKKNYYICF